MLEFKKISQQDFRILNGGSDMPRMRSDFDLASIENLRKRDQKLFDKQQSNIQGFDNIEQQTKESESNRQSGKRGVKRKTPKQIQALELLF